MKAKARGRRTAWNGGGFLSRPLPFRRAVAAVIIVLLVAVALLIAAAERADFARAAELVRTQEQNVGVLVEVDYRGRSGTYYMVEVDGHERTLAYGEFITDETPGAAVRFVVDPEDESRPIAVGSPEDWDEEPLGIGLTLALVTLALVLGGLVASRLVPEDLGGPSALASKVREQKRAPLR